MSNKILFRINAGAQYGLGHFYRSVAVANKLVEKGFEVHFMHNSSKFWEEKDTIEDLRGIANYFSNQDDCFDDDINTIVKKKYNAVILDGNFVYSKDAWNRLRKKGVRLINYQNLSCSRHLCDVYIIPSIHQQADFFSEFDDQKTRIYQGLQFLTFNNKLKGINRVKRNCSIRKIGITTGGSDPKNILKTIFNYVKDNTKFHFVFFYGSNYMFKEGLQDFKSSNTTVTPYRIEDVLATDLLISAFGVSTYEFLLLGMPIIAIGHQQSNAAAADYLAAHTGAILSLGDVEKLSAEILNHTIAKLAENNLDIKNMLQNSSKLMDFQGNERVANIITNEE